MEIGPASEMSCFFKKKLDSVRINIVVSINFIHVVFSHLSTRDNLVMQAFVWLCMVWFRVIRFGAAWFGASYI